MQHTADVEEGQARQHFENLDRADVHGIFAAALGTVTSDRSFGVLVVQLEQEVDELARAGANADVKEHEHDLHLLGGLPGADPFNQGLHGRRAQAIARVQRRDLLLGVVAEGRRFSVTQDASICQEHHA